MQKKMRLYPKVQCHQSLARTSMFVFLVLIVFGFQNQLRAQQLLSLQDAIAIALQNNYDIQLAESDSARLGLDYTYRNVVFLPRLNA
ncbi:MAG TPA: hypothetical protein PLR30_17115, partial [Saprospiraceae bacterium]|nr:hypothetical protein [Saprospiraceae bacterium]